MSHWLTDMLIKTESPRRSRRRTNSIATSARISCTTTFHLFCPVSSSRMIPEKSSGTNGSTVLNTVENMLAAKIFLLIFQEYLNRKKKFLNIVPDFFLLIFISRMNLYQTTVILLSAAACENTLNIIFTFSL